MVPTPRAAVLARSLLILGLCVVTCGQAAPGERTPAPVMSHQGADWLERSDRDKEEKPYEVIKAMGLEAGDVIADIGCGTGYYTRKIAKAVAPGGKVYGVDIQPEMLEKLEALCAKEGLTNVESVLGDEDDPKLPDASIDWIILVDAYHEFQDPVGMLEKMRTCLKPDGKVALLEYRLEGTTANHIKVDHRMSIPQVLGEWAPAGFELVEIREFLPTQHYFVFQKAPKYRTPQESIEE
jgi:ubiquinone/menaquinone biosynthesis C-methylase UbiE